MQTYQHLDASCEATTGVPYCWGCKRFMKLIRVTPKFGMMPRLDTYRCEGCGDVETIEADAG